MNQAKHTPNEERSDRSRTWVRPRVSRIGASAAEFAVAPLADGGDTMS